MRASFAIFVFAAAVPCGHAVLAALAKSGFRPAAFLGTTAQRGGDAGASVLEVGVASNRSKPEGAPPSPEAEAVTQEWYLIQRVGVQHSRGAEQPRSPLAEQTANSNVCLTHGNSPDNVGGQSLIWETCQDDYLDGRIQIIPQLQEQQLFKFRLDGKIEAKLGGCVRHVDCGDQSIYDLGNCNEGDLTVSFKVNKAIANSVNHLKPMGNPVQAITADNRCEFCGPYQVTERCVGRRMPDGGCQKNWAAQPGWTRMSTQYIGDMASMGRSDIRDPEQFATGVIENIRTGDVLDSAMDGFGPTGPRGLICGSGATESPGSRSFFYFIKKGNSQNRIAGTGANTGANSR